jgi:hypothetical protein
MTDPLTIFPADQRGLLDGSYKRVSYSDIGQHLLDGWEVARLTDEHFHPSDRHGIMMKMPTRRLVLDLPLPPSVNTMMRKLGNRSPSVQKWITRADPYILMVKPIRGVAGPYIVNITWPKYSFGMFDCDNRIKVLKDYLQRVEAIDDDLYCWRLTAEFGDMPKGMCRVEIWPKE